MNILLISAFVFGVFAVSISACYQEKSYLDNRLLIDNKSEAEIIYVFSKEYPDTDGFRFESCPYDDIAFRVEAKHSKRCVLRANRWEWILNDIPSNTFMIYVYNVDTFNKYYYIANGCDSIKKTNLVLKRFDITLDYLNNNNWTLVYE